MKGKGIQSMTTFFEKFDTYEEIQAQKQQDREQSKTQISSSGIQKNKQGDIVLTNSKLIRDLRDISSDEDSNKRFKRKAVPQQKKQRQFVQPVKEKVVVVQEDPKIQQELLEKEKRAKAKKIHQNRGREYIGSYDEAPEYLQDNNFILNGYRINFTTTKKIFKSLFLLHNESVNVWSHIFGVCLFIILVGYTIVYMAPPGIHGSSGNQYGMTWFREFGSTDSRTQFLLNDKLSRFRVPKEDKNQNLSGQIDQQIEEIFTEVLKPDNLQLHNETLNSHPHASLFESIEEFVIGAYNLITDPSPYIQGTDSFNKFKTVFSKLPQYLTNHVSEAVDELRQDDHFGDYYLIKFNYIKRLISYLGTKTQQWIENMQQLADSKTFDWIDIKPIFNDPKHYILYVPRWPLFIHLFSAILCMTFSATFHLFTAHSHDVNNFLSRLDYCGISILIAGSNTPPLYYSFFCQETIFWRNVYLGSMYFVCFCCFVLLLMPQYNKPKYRPLRGILFVICGLLSVVPIYHIEFLTHKSYIHDFHTSPWLLGGVLYILGAVLYMLKFPERLKPGLFDYFGGSHQLFHLLIVSAALVHYWASIQCFHDRQIFQCPNETLDLLP
eukprot:403357598